MLEKLEKERPLLTDIKYALLSALGLIIIAYAAHGIEHVHFEESCIDRLINPLTGN